VPSNIAALGPKLFHHVKQTINHRLYAAESLFSIGLAPRLLLPT